MTVSNSFVSVVAVLRDAQPYLEDFVRECVAVLQEHYQHHELILIEDGSADATVRNLEPLLREFPFIRLIRLTRRYGPDRALVAGLDSAIGDFVVLLEAACDPPGEIPALVSLAQKGHGVVTGVASFRQAESLPLRTLRRLFHGLCHRLFAIPYPPFATRFQVLSRAAAGVATQVLRRCPHFPLLANQLGYRGATHAYQRRALHPDADRLGTLDKIDRGLAIVVLNSRSPLRVVSYLGMTAGGLNLLYACYVMLVNLVSSHVAPGWTTMSLQISSMFFLVFLVLVVVCEYLGWLLEEALDRPLYQVLEERNSSVLPLREHNVLDRSVLPLRDPNGLDRAA